jgi:hypothetical protein
VKAGGASQGEAHLRIFGMSLNLMNQLSTLGRTPVIIGRTRSRFPAGEEDAVSLIFKGTISQAYTDLGGAPEGFSSRRVLDAVPGGAVDPANQLPRRRRCCPDSAGLATQMGMTFENNGVSVILANPYFPGQRRHRPKPW